MNSTDPRYDFPDENLFDADWAQIENEQEYDPYQDEQFGKREAADGE